MLGSDLDYTCFIIKTTVLHSVGEILEYISMIMIHEKEGNKTISVLGITHFKQENQ